MNRIQTAGLVMALALASSAAWAKIPPPPPPDDKAKAAAEEKKAKDAVAAEKAKADQAAAEDKAVKNFQSNMKKMDTQADADRGRCGTGARAGNRRQGTRES